MLVQVDQVGSFCADKFFNRVSIILKKGINQMNAKEMPM
jgi:hypothetical protein